MGCGLPDPLEFLEPTANCLGPYSVAGAGELDRAAIARSEIVLKRIFTSPWTDAAGQTHEPIVGSERSFCDEFGGVHIKFVSDDAFKCDTGECDGWSSFADGVSLTYDGRSFAHELIHVHEYVNWIWDTGDHPHWDPKGYFYFNDYVWHDAKPTPLVTP